MKELKDLKVGDLVILVYNGILNKEKSVQKIEKITPAGLIKVKKEWFFPDGDAIFNESKHIEIVTTNRSDELTKQSYIAATLNEIHNLKYLAYDQAVEIHNLLKKWGLSDDS